MTMVSLGTTALEGRNRTQDYLDRTRSQKNVNKMNFNKVNEKFCI